MCMGQRARNRRTRKCFDGVTTISRKERPEERLFLRYIFNMKVRRLRLPSGLLGSVPEGKMSLHVAAVVGMGTRMHLVGDILRNSGVECPTSLEIPGRH